MRHTAVGIVLAVVVLFGGMGIASAVSHQTKLVFEPSTIRQSTLCVPEVFTSIPAWGVSNTTLGTVEATTGGCAVLTYGRAGSFIVTASFSDAQGNKKVDSVNIVVNGSVNEGDLTVDGQ